MSRHSGGGGGYTGMAGIVILLLALGALGVLGDVIIRIGGCVVMFWLACGLSSLLLAKTSPLARTESTTFGGLAAVVWFFSPWVAGIIVVGGLGTLALAQVFD